MFEELFTRRGLEVRALAEPVERRESRPRRAKRARPMAPTTVLKVVPNTPQYCTLVLCMRA